MTASFAAAVRKCGLQYTQGPVTRSPETSVSTLSHVSLATPDGKLHPNVTRPNAGRPQIVAKDGIRVIKNGSIVTLFDLLNAMSLNPLNYREPEVFVETQCCILPRSRSGTTQFCPVLDTPVRQDDGATTLVFVCSSMGVTVYTNNTPGGWLFLDSNGQSAWYGAEEDGSADPSAMTIEERRENIIAVIQVPVVPCRNETMGSGPSASRSAGTARVAAGDLVGKRHVPPEMDGRRDESRAILVTVCSVWLTDGEPDASVARDILVRMAEMSFSNLFGAPTKAAASKPVPQPVPPKACGTDSSFLPNTPTAVPIAVHCVPSFANFVAAFESRLHTIEAAYGSRMASMERMLNRLDADSRAPRKDLDAARAEIQEANQRIRVLEGKLDVATSNLDEARARAERQDSAIRILEMEMRLMRERFAVLEGRAGPPSGATPEDAYFAAARAWGGRHFS